MQEDGESILFRNIVMNNRTQASLLCHASLDETLKNPAKYIAVTKALIPRTRECRVMCVFIVAPILAHRSNKTSEQPARSGLRKLLRSRFGELGRLLLGFQRHAARIFFGSRGPQISLQNSLKGHLLATLGS
jgi:hypothetical protein